MSISLRHAWRLPAGAGLMLLLAVAAGCGGRPAPAVEELKPPAVTVMQPVALTVADDFEDTGLTVPIEEVELRAQVSGYLLEKVVPDGSVVKKGQLLFKIDPAVYQAALQQQQAALGRWRATYDKAAADERRNKALVPTGAISREEYEVSVAQVLVAEAEYHAGEAAIKSAQLDVDHTQIFSPIDGRVGKSRFAVGDLIPVGTSDPSTIITTVVSGNPVWVEFSAPEKTLLEYRDQMRSADPKYRPEHIKDLNAPVFVGLETEKGFPHQGVLDFVDNRVDPNTGTLKLRGVFDDPNGALMPGLRVRVRLPLGDPKPELLVPEEAIGSDQDQKYVLAVDAENTVVRLPVTLGRQVYLEGVKQPYRVVAEGLSHRPRVIVIGLLQARVGAKVAPVDAAPPAAKLAS